MYYPLTSSEKNWHILKTIADVVMVIKLTSNLQLDSYPRENFGEIVIISSW